LHLSGPLAHPLPMDITLIGGPTALLEIDGVFSQQNVMPLWKAGRIIPKECNTFSEVGFQE